MGRRGDNSVSQATYVLGIRLSLIILIVRPKSVIKMLAKGITMFWLKHYVSNFNTHEKYKDKSCLTPAFVVLLTEISCFKNSVNYRSEMEEPDKEKAFLNAIRDIKERGLSVRKAAKKWRVAKSTLQDKLSGKAEKKRSGPCTVLTQAEENRFAEWLIERAKRGFGATKDEFLDCVKTFIEKDKRETKFTGNRPGNKWYRGFAKRNPQVRLRSARPLDKKRAKITPKDVDEWFENYEKFIRDVGVADCPGQIWNCDETGFDLQGRAGKVMGPTSTKEQPYRVITGTKEHITVLPCFNAAGQYIPPYILYPGKRIPNQYNLLEGGVPGSCYSLTEKGYMDTPTFFISVVREAVYSQFTTCEARCAASR